MMIANIIRINQRREIEENIFSKKCDLTLEINNIEKINELRNKYDAAKNKTIKIIALIIFIVLALTFALAVKSDPLSITAFIFVSIFVITLIGSTITNLYPPFVIDSNKFDVNLYTGLSLSLPLGKNESVELIKYNNNLWILKINDSEYSISFPTIEYHPENSIIIKDYIKEIDLSCDYGFIITLPESLKATLEDYQ